MLLNCYGCYLALSYSLGSIALVHCTSIATISRRGVKEKLYFPEKLLTWRGDVVLRPPLVDWYEQYWSPGHWRASFLPTRRPSCSPTLYCQSTWLHTPRLGGTTHAHLFFYVVVSRPRPRDLCTSIAHISLRGVQRTTSPRHLSSLLWEKNNWHSPSHFILTTTLYINSIMLKTLNYFKMIPILVESFCNLH